MVQNTWMALVRNAHTIQEPHAVLKWLLVTAKRGAWEVVRKQRDDQKRRTELPDDLLDGPVGALPSSDPTPETQVLEVERDRHLWRAVLQLPERCQQLLRLISLADRPDYKFISSAIGMPVGSIGSNRGRCLAKLRDIMESDQGTGHGKHHERADRVQPGRTDGHDRHPGSRGSRADQLDARPGTRGSRRAVALRDHPGGPRGRGHGARVRGCTGDVRPRRGAPVEARTITFTAESLTVMITLSTRDDTRIRIDGWAAPAGELAVELHRPDGMVSTVTDEDGRFVFDDVAPARRAFCCGHPARRATP
ncbi:sigma-70 family RNA polymerase sigma factor [Oerskovia sp. M15]